MASTNSAPIEVPPYQVQPLITNVLYGPDASDAAFTVGVKCVQALGSEIYAGCFNGDLLRFALQINGPNQPGSYALVSRRTLPTGKPVEEIALIPSISVFSDRQIFLCIVPSLEPVPGIKPICNVMCFAVDHRHIVLPSLPIDSYTSFSR